MFLEFLKFFLASGAIFLWTVCALAALGYLPEFAKWLEEPGRIIQILTWIIAITVSTISWLMPKDSIWYSLAPELTGIAITVVIIESLGYYRAHLLYKQEILDQFGSKSNDSALEAVRIATRHRWVFDGSLDGRDLSGAQLSNASLAHARLIRTNLEDACLQNAQLQYAELEQANLTCADLQNANLTGANLTRAKLIGANLFGVQLISARLAGAYLEAVELQETNLLGANLNGQELQSRIFDKMYLKGTQFQNTNLHSTRFRYANLGGARFVGADLYNTDFEGAYLGGVDFSEAKNIEFAQFHIAQFSSATIWPMNFSPPSNAIKVG